MQPQQLITRIEQQLQQQQERLQHLKHLYKTEVTCAESQHLEDLPQMDARLQHQLRQLHDLKADLGFPTTPTPTPPPQKDGSRSGGVRFSGEASSKADGGGKLRRKNTGYFPPRGSWALEDEEDEDEIQSGGKPAVQFAPTVTQADGAGRLQRKATGFFPPGGGNMLQFAMMMEAMEEG
eukprot:TRINITY_DN102980_c0_g1_i1.p1 TRINITY_DN102980_c0_g1~~TRINITY_DN102980_c0_g1_i1.p1  ORF type:complete len:179 (+),score=39.67 TRINITY_DN102980_c0_g1_i1:44-580(+)